MDYNSIDERSRLFLRNWQDIWAAYIADDMQELKAAIYKQAKKVADCGGTRFSEECERIDRRVRGDHENRHDNLSRISKAVRQNRIY